MLSHAERKHESSEELFVLLHYFSGPFIENLYPFGHLALQVGYYYLSYAISSDTESHVVDLREENAVIQDQKRYSGKYYRIQLETDSVPKFDYREWELKWNPTDFKFGTNNSANSAAFCLKKLGIVDELSDLNENAKPRTAGKIYANIARKQLLERKNKIIKNDDPIIIKLQKILQNIIENLKLLQLDVLEKNKEVEEIDEQIIALQNLRHLLPIHHLKQIENIIHYYSHQYQKLSDDLAPCLVLITRSMGSEKKDDEGAYVAYQALQEKNKIDYQYKLSQFKKIIQQLESVIESANKSTVLITISKYQKQLSDEKLKQLSELVKLFEESQAYLFASYAPENILDLSQYEAIKSKVIEFDEVVQQFSQHNQLEKFNQQLKSFIDEMKKWVTLPQQFIFKNCLEEKQQGSAPVNSLYIDWLLYKMNEIYYWAGKQPIFPGAYPKRDFLKDAIKKLFLAIEDQAFDRESFLLFVRENIVSYWKNLGLAVDQLNAETKKWFLERDIGCLLRQIAIFFPDFNFDVQVRALMNNFPVDVLALDNKHELIRSLFLMVEELSTKNLMHERLLFSWQRLLFFWEQKILSEQAVLEEMMTDMNRIIQFSSDPEFVKSLKTIMNVFLNPNGPPAEEKNDLIDQAKLKATVDTLVGKYEASRSPLWAKTKSDLVQVLNTTHGKLCDKSFSQSELEELIKVFIKDCINIQRTRIMGKEYDVILDPLKLIIPPDLMKKIIEEVVKEINAEDKKAKLTVSTFVSATDNEKRLAFSN